MTISGNLLKMKTKLADVVHYELPLSENFVPLNEHIGKQITLTFEGRINCIHSGELIKKSYNQGYSFKAFKTLAECDMCIVKPELCHYAKGTCRDSKWGDEHCMIDHYIYLSNSSHVKIGITRHTQLPTRWIDQGAIQGLQILKVKNRMISGILENEIRSSFSDKTDWRKMLSNDIQTEDLYFLRDKLFEEFGEVIDENDAEDLDAPITEIKYPVTEFPKKITSLSFDKKKQIKGELLGIKGQYLILSTGVLNIRKHQGYFVHLEIGA